MWRGQCRRPRPIDNLAAYLVTAVINQANRELRELIPERNRDSREVESVGAVVADSAASTADAIALKDALAGLPRREQQAVVSRHQWQLTVTEAAHTMGVSEGAVKRYTYRRGSRGCALYAPQKSEHDALRHAEATTPSRCPRHRWLEQTPPSVTAGARPHRLVSWTS